jgi:hypothetical protein
VLSSGMPGVHYDVYVVITSCSVLNIWAVGALSELSDCFSLRIGCFMYLYSAFLGGRSICGVFLDSVCIIP